MAYRDDVDALYTRASMLQREVDEMREQLATRDRELADLRGHPFRPDDTSPGMRAVRELPPPDEVLARLTDREESDHRSWLDEMPDPPRTVVPTGMPVIPLPPPIPNPKVRRGKVLERARDLLGALSDDRLVLIGAVIEGIVGDDATPQALDQLRELAERVVNERAGRA